ncbi:class Ib ribonucleoside-diphosphate reductase assembly flavoprotein NrdI [Salmonella enterica subsp. enterica]|nr:class Ib ribonucleoside-diphosphate reductase assembly flavoprotein NrdI [Salmonella enterica subsp. enterica]
MAGAVPQVIRFLNDEHNRARIRGVVPPVSAISAMMLGMRWRCDNTTKEMQYLQLYRFELMGTQREHR